LTVLASKGMTALDAFGLLRFVEARDTAPCHAGSTLAFTQPGAPMIRICSLQFRRGLHRIAVPRTQSQPRYAGRPTLFFRAADACRQFGSNCLRTGSGSIAISVDHEC
jgi:hypothetical protein